MLIRSNIVLGVVAFTAALVLGLGFWIYRFATKSFPVYDGTGSISGLASNVTVLSDEFGVPHIRANAEEDAYAAVGYIHASQRLWQMELSRRVGEGRLSEILGSPALKTDKLFRTLGLRQMAVRLADSLDPATRRALEAYARGVNAYVDGHTGRLAVEFDVLNTTPERWRVEHSLLISRLMAWELNHARWVDLLHNKLVRKFGVSKTHELLPDYPPAAARIIEDLAERSPKQPLSGQLFEAEQSYAALVGLGGMGSGSNSWVLSSTRTTTGKPLLANDPHLSLMSPARWFELQVTAPGLNVSGATIAGVPFVVVGHNDRIAWGLTNAMFDDEDFFVEEVDTLERPQHYRLNGAWKDLGISVDTIVVKDGPPVLLTLYRTHRGPIVNRIEGGAANEPNLISMRWMGHECTRESDALYRINRAEHWSEFASAVNLFCVPAQNFVYADIDGNIGYLCGGKLPDVKGRGAGLVYPGWTDEYDWKQYIPRNEMPRLLNPPAGLIATANNKMVGDSYPHYLSNSWEPSWRADRIREFFADLAIASPEDMRRLQTDVLSPHARALVPVILRAFDQVEVLDTDVRTALNYFKNWNFEMRPEDVSTTLFEEWFVKTTQNTLHDELGDELFGLYDTLASTPLKAMSALLEDSSSTWFDNVLTPARETRDDVVRASLVDAIRSLKGKLGGELKEWQWQRLHKVTFAHVFSQNTLLRPMFTLGPFATGGAHSTVNVGSFSMANPFKQTVGASTRQIFDLSNWDKSRAITAPGQSGHPYETHVDDQIQLWLNGEYRTMPFSREAVDRECRHILILKTAP